MVEGEEGGGDKSGGPECVIDGEASEDEPAPEVFFDERMGEGEEDGEGDEIVEDAEGGEFGGDERFESLGVGDDEWMCEVDEEEGGDAGDEA